MRTGLLLALGLLPGCAALTAATGGLTQVVSAERLEPGGKGLFVVRPFVLEPECAMSVNDPIGATPLDCAAEFIVGCDATTTDLAPFCAPVIERGGLRDSLYPGDKVGP